MDRDPTITRPYVDECSHIAEFLLNHQAKDSLIDQTANSNQCYWRKYA